MPKILSVNISKKKGIPKASIPEGNFIEEFGLEGDAHAGSGIDKLVYLELKVLIR